MQKNPSVAKVALITGAARRIGAEIAQTLHDAGMNIVLHYHVCEEEAASLCKRFNQKRERSAVAICADLEEPEIEKTLIQKALEPWKRLDVLINNASRFYRTPFGEITDFAFDDLMKINLKAPFLLAQAAAPALTKHGGCIINILDTHIDRPLRHYSIYCISKSALAMATTVLAKELGPKVRVNGIAPGAILWPEGENTLSQEAKDKIIAKTTLLRVGLPEDVAKAVLFFVCDANYATGQILSIDGGRMLTG